MIYYLSHIVLKHSRERRVTVKRQLTERHLHPLRPNVRRHCEMCLSVLGSHIAVARSGHHYGLSSISSSYDNG